MEFVKCVEIMAELLALRNQGDLKDQHESDNSIPAETCSPTLRFVCNGQIWIKQESLCGASGLDSPRDEITMICRAKFEGIEEQCLNRFIIRICMF